MISTSITNNSITVVITTQNNPFEKGTNKVYTLNRGNINYDAVLEAIRNNDEVLIETLCNITKSIETFTEGNVTVKDGHVYYGNNLVEGIIVERTLDFIKNKLPVQPLLKFINKLMNNPSARAVRELYKFLEHKNMPITPDGNFLAYKGVQTDYYSFTSGSINVLSGKVDNGKIYNGIGEYILVSRNQVCDDKEIGCSSGLHAGSVKYATEFGSRGKVVIVEINPCDVVSIPTDCNCEKLRTCAYKVVGEYDVPLDNNYCDKYDTTDNTCNDEDECDDDFNSESDDEDDFNSFQDEIDDAYVQGHECGHQDGLNDFGFNDSCCEVWDSDVMDSYREGYQNGYDIGVTDRAKS